MENFDVKQYCDLFKMFNKMPHKRECEARLKWFFKENNDVTFKEVLEATKAYLVFNIKDNGKYVREPHYFIKKGVGSNITSDLESWVAKLRSAKTMRERRDPQNTIQ